MTSPARSGYGLVGEHDAFGLARRARRGHHHRVALLDANAVGERMLIPVGAHDAGGTQRVEHHLSRRGGKPWVERSSGIAGVPDGPQRIDEADAPGEVECDELRHRSVG